MFTDLLAQAISPGVCLLKESLPQNGKGSLDKTLRITNIRNIIRKAANLSYEF